MRQSDKKCSACPNDCVVCQENEGGGGATCKSCGLGFRLDTTTGECLECSKKTNTDGCGECDD